MTKGQNFSLALTPDSSQIPREKPLKVIKVFWAGKGIMAVL